MADPAEDRTASFRRDAETAAANIKREAEASPGRVGGEFQRAKEQIAQTAAAGRDELADDLRRLSSDVASLKDTVAQLAKTVAAEIGEAAGDIGSSSPRREGAGRLDGHRVREGRAAQSIGGRRCGPGHRTGDRLKRTPLMFSSLLGAIGFDLKRQARHIVMTVVFALIGAILIALALGFGIAALYEWLKHQYGTLPALGILGGAWAVLGVTFLCLAFLRPGPRQRQPAAVAANPRIRLPRSRKQPNRPWIRRPA